MYYKVKAIFTASLAVFLLCFAAASGCTCGAIDGAVRSHLFKRKTHSTALELAYLGIAVNPVNEFEHNDKQENAR